MRTIDFEKETSFFFQGKEMVVLGAKDVPADAIEQKLSNGAVATPMGLWGTLGWVDNSPLDFKGKIAFSQFGNEHSLGETGLLVDELKSFIPTINAQNKVTEYFLNLTDTRLRLPEGNEFDFNEIPELRLTLFVGADEGALLYYEHSEKGQPDENGDFTETGQFIEFILPEPTDPNFGFDRDRLNYKIRVVPRKKFSLGKHKKLKLATANRKSQFILKALVFKRDNKQEAINVLKDFTRAINSAIPMNERASDEILDFSSFSPKYKLWKYDSGLRKLVLVHSSSEIDTSQSTLLLIHGTFSTTAKSFKHLVGTSYKTSPSFLHYLIEEKHYQQILAFDHPTCEEDAMDNVKVLVDRLLSGVHFGANKLDVIASSRGTVVAECLGMYPSAKNRIELGKVMLFSANGSGYLKSDGPVGTFLSIYKLVFAGPELKLILGLAQFSKQFLLTRLPGLDQLVPNGDRLNTLLSARQNNPETVYLKFVADWDKQLISGRFKRVLTSGADVVIRAFLGKEHDWVIGCSEQRISPISALSRKSVEYKCSHGRFFEADFPVPKDCVYRNLIEFMKE